MAFIANRSVNLLNLHTGLRAMAMAGGGAFFVPHLMKSGFSAAAVMVIIAMILLGRLAIRSLILPVAERAGLRKLLMFGSLANAVQYMMVGDVSGVGAMLVALIVTSAVGDMVYWTCYHAYFASVGDDQHRGQQIGAREAIAAVVGIASPVLMGMALTTFGARIAFGLTAALLALSVLPLMLTPDVAVQRLARTTRAASLDGILIFVADGWIAAGVGIVWSMALFSALGESFTSYGGALALAALAGAAGSLILGRFIDGGGGVRAVAISVATLAAIIAARMIGTTDVAMALFANAAGAFAMCIYVPTLMAAIYTLAKQSPCVMRFHIATEGGWDVGAASALLLTALMTWLGAPLAAGVALAFVGLTLSAVLLRRYYREAERKRAAMA